MSTWEIKGKNDVVKAIINSLEYNGKWMEERYVSATIDLPVPIDFAIGDYLIYRGERFEINYDPGKIKSAPPEKKGDGFKYENVKFNDLSDELTRCEFLDVVPNDNLLHYTSLPKFRFYGSVRDLAGRIKANLDRVYPGQWTIAVSPEYSDTKELNISVEPINVKGALGFVVNDFKTYYTINGRTITIGAAGIPAAHLFKYGEGNGLYEIAQNAEADQKIVTRLRAYGSTRNLPHRYYNSLSGANGLKLVPDNMAVSNLMLPDFPYNTLDPYIDSANKAALGIREGTIFFDGSQEGLEEIYPSIEGMTAEQLKAAGVPCNSTGNLNELVSADQMSDDGVGVINGDKTEAEPPTFKVTVKDLGFNLWNHRTSEAPVLSFKTGMLGGREFEIVNCEAIKGSGDKTVGYELELNRVYDDDIKLWFPYKDYNAKGSDQNTSFPDKFELLHIEMPEVYVKAAAQRLKEAAEAWLAKNDYSRSVYAPKVDEIFMARQHDEAMASGGTIASLHDTLCEGMLMLFEDEDLNIDASVFIDQLTIKEGDGPVPTYEVVLKEEKTVGRLDKMQNQIDSLASGIGQSGGYNAAQIRALIETYGGRRFLSKLEDDTAAGVIEFLRGLVADEVARLRGGAEFGDFESGMSTGRGAAIDDAGNGELESLRVRSYLEVLELLINRLQAIEGDTVLTEGDQITEVTDLGNGNYRLKLKEKWDGYFTAMTVDTVLRGIYNTMSRGGGDYYTSWMLVTSVDTAANELTVMLYGDDEVPGEKNFAPIAMMNIARWGHRTDDRRQRCLYLTSTEGRIVNLVGVRQPLLTAANYGSTFGRLPEFISRAFGFAEGQEGVYTKYLFVENLFHVDHLGVPLPTVRDRGLWTAGADYYDGTALREATGDYEISDVWHSGRRWRCCKLATTAEPGATTTDWAYIEGLTMVSQKIEYALSLSGTVTPAESAWSETQPEPKPLMWLWTRTTLTFSDGSVSVSYTKSYIAKDGASYSDNLLTGSAKGWSNSDYPTATLYFGDDKPAAGEKFTATLWGAQLGDGKTHFALYNSGGWVSPGNFTDMGDGRYMLQGVWKDDDGNGHTATTEFVNIYAMPSSVTGVTSSIMKVKLERGWNDTPVWTPNAADTEAVAVTLSNDSHVFEGDTEKAVAATTSIGVTAYKGERQIETTVGTITGLPTGMTALVKLDGTMQTSVTVSVTTALTQRQGVLTIPVTADGKTYIKQFSWSLSLKGDKGDKGDDGAKGDRGPALRGPQKWDDVADGFAFESGAEGEDFLDVVMTESLKPGSTTEKQLNFFVCIQSHPKSATIRPDAAGSQYWKPMSTIEFVATKILLAQYAVIKNLGVESLEMKDADGNVIAYIHDGNVLFNKGTFSNVKIVAGGTNDQRIELDPETKSIRIYDEAGNECLTIDGTRQEREAIEGYKLELTAPGSALTPWTLPIAKTTAPAGVTQSPTLLTYTPSEDSYITVNVPKLTLAVKRETPSSPTEITGGTEVRVTLQVAQGTEVANEEIGSYLLENGTTDMSEHTVEVESIRKSFKVKAGVAMTLKLFVEAHFASGSVKLTEPTATYVFDRYQSKIFANGMTLMRTNRDYLTIYADKNGRIYLDRGSTVGSCHRFNGVTQPATLYTARVWNDIDNAAPTVYAGKATVTKTSTPGVWKVKLPPDPLVHTGNTLAWPVCNTGGWTVAETGRALENGALTFTIQTCNQQGVAAFGAGFTIEIKLY